MFAGLFGDIDGIVVIPQAIAEKVFETCLGKIEREAYVRQQLLEGRSVTDVFQETGIL